ncbi:MAG TPA: hypothetical protein VJU17_09660, partial [Gemmatimonadales bacterium]|nr:hypothetical protein [Gemmatimonadales bacterium]
MSLWAAAMGLLVVLACGGKSEKPTYDSTVLSSDTSSDTTRGTPGPKFTTPFDSVSPDSLLAYVDSELQWDTREGAGDMQRLMVGECPDSCHYGPKVRIQPEKRAHQNSANSLSQRPGRIIARLINLDSEEYPKMNIGAHDTVYWAVERVQPVNDTLSRGRSLLISRKKLHDTSLVAAKPESLEVSEHPSGYWRQALTRWIW